MINKYTQGESVAFSLPKYLNEQCTTAQVKRGSAMEALSNITVKQSTLSEKKDALTINPDRAGLCTGYFTGSFSTENLIGGRYYLQLNITTTNTNGDTITKKRKAVFHVTRAE